MKSPFLDNDLVQLAYRVPSELQGSVQHLLRVIEQGDSRLAGIGTDRAHRPQDGTIRRFASRSCQELTAKAEFAYDYGMPNWLAKLDHILRPIRPERFFLGRHKFYHFRVWYRDTLAPEVRQILLDSRSLSRPYINRRRVEEVVSAHTKGIANHTIALHKLLSCELLHRTLLDAN
jgi:asparagine synthase (glutamine-hydrolysing)